MLSDFYEDFRFCSECGTYVHYLLSPELAFCAECLSPVKLYSVKDKRRVLGDKKKRAGRTDPLGVDAEPFTLPSTLGGRRPPTISG